LTEIVYSTQRVKNLGGRKIQNPVHFVSPEAGVKTVYVQDGFPAVVDAYSRVEGVKIRPLSELPGQSAPTAPADKKEK
jgi:hypothetical protein